jgi:Fe-S cluster biosynthesis and repair protein YggX
MSNNKLMTGILGVGAVAALVGLYYMAKDDEVEIKFDPKVHTKEKLLEVLNDFELEYASLYLHWYSMMKTKEKELGKGKIPPDTMEAVKQQIQTLTGDVDEEIFANHKISQSTFDEWMEKHKTDPKISQFTKRLSQNFEKLMRVEKPEFNFTYPKELTKQVYLKYIKAAYAKFRYDIYHAVQNKLRQTGAPSVTEDEFNEIIKQ